MADPFLYFEDGKPLDTNFPESAKGLLYYEDGTPYTAASGSAPLELSVFDSPSIAEYAFLGDTLLSVFDNITKAEVIEISLDVLNINRFDSVTTIESATPFVIPIPANEVNVFDTLNAITEFTEAAFVWLIDVFDATNATTESATLEVQLGINAFDAPSILEYAEGFLPILVFSVAEVSGLLITEHIDVIDLIVELGVTVDLILIAEDPVLNIPIEIHLGGSDPASLLCHFDDNLNDLVRGITPTITGSFVTLDNATSKFGRGSVNFAPSGGGSNYLNFASNRAFDWRNDFTIDIEFKASSILGGQSRAHIWDNGNFTTGGIALGITTSGIITVMAEGNFQISSGTGFLNGAYHQVRVARSAGTIRLFVDGTKVGVDYVNTQQFVGGDLRLGQGFFGGTNERFTGNIDELRIVEGVALSTATFTPPTLPWDASELYFIEESFTYGLTPLFLNVGAGDLADLLCHFDTNYNDEVAGLVPTETNSARITIDTGTKKFGAGSVKFTPINSTEEVYLTYAANPKFDFSGDFNIDIRFRFEAGASTATYKFLWSKGPWATTGIALAFIHGSGGIFLLYNGNFQNIYNASDLRDGLFHHVAVKRVGSTMTLSVDGIASTGGSSDPYTDTTTGHTLEVGHSTFSSAAYKPWTGWLDELRVVKGSGVFTPPFTPPLIEYSLPEQATIVESASVSVLLGIIVNDTLSSIVEDVALSTELNISIYDEASIIEDAIVLFDSPYAEGFDEITTTESVSISLDVLNINNLNEIIILINEEVELIDLVVELETPYDEATVSEDSSLSLDVLNINISESTISVTEDVVGFLPILVVTVEDLVGYTESLDINLDALHITVLEPFHVVITEHTDVVDLVVEVGIVMEAINPVEAVSASLDQLFLSVDDNASISEFTYVLDLVIELGEVSDEASIAENLAINLDVLNIDVEETLGAIEDYADVQLPELVIDAFDVVAIAEFTNLLDLVIDLGIVFDSPTATENISVSLDALFLEVFDSPSVVEFVQVTDLVIELGAVSDNISIAEDFALYLDSLHISDAFDLASILEYANIFDEVVELGIVYDQSNIAEDVQIYLDVLYVSVNEATITVTEYAQVIDLIVEVDAGFEVIGTTESVSVSLDVLNVDVTEPFNFVITEHVDVLDLVVEVGIVMEPIPVQESASIFFDVLNLSVGDDSTIQEYAEGAYDILSISIDELIAAAEAIANDMPINFFVAEQRGMSIITVSHF